MTGGNGFLGAAFLARQTGDDEIVTLGRSRPAGPVAAHIDVDFAKAGELEGKIAAGHLPASVDAIMHLAVSRQHRGFPKTALDMFQVNVATTAALMDYAVRAGVGHVILGSTGTVYHPFSGRPLREEDTRRPESYFGWSKLAAEDLARRYAPQQFDLFIPRIFVPYGPGQSDRMIDSLIGKVGAGEPVTIPLTGPGLTSAPIFLDDLVDVIEGALRQRWSGVYNLAGEEVLSLDEMAGIIGEVIGCAPVIERRSSANGAFMAPDISRLRTLVDVSRFVRFREGVERTVAARLAGATGGA